MLIHYTIESNCHIEVSMSARSSLSGAKELTLEQKKYVLAAKNKLGKGDDNWSEIAEGYQILDVRISNWRERIDPSA